MYPNLQTFFRDAEPFLAAFNAWATTHHPAAHADHLCYKCGDAAEFEHIRALFEKESVFVYQSIISARRIAIIRFPHVLATVLGDITHLELADQKPDGSQISGFDHIEIYPTQTSVEELAGTLEKQGVSFEKVVRPHHTTYDAGIRDAFKVRLEAEALVEKIKMTEMI